MSHGPNANIHQSSAWSSSIESGPSLHLQVSVQLLGRAPHPPTQGSTEAVAAKRKEKNPPQEPFFTSAELSQMWAWLNYHVPKLAFDLLLFDYLSHRFLICIRAEPIFSLHLIWYFFHIDDLRGANHSDLLLAKSQHQRTAQVPAHQDYSITHTYIGFLLQKELTQN